MGNLVKYGSYSPDEAEEDEKELSKGSGQMMQLQVGENRVRVLPPLEGRKLMTVTWQHYIEMPGLESAIRFNCPRNMLKKHCLACDAADKLASTGNPADKARSDSLWPKKRVYIAVIDRANPEEGPKMLPIGKQIAEALTALRKNEDIGGDFTDPTDDGFDIVITKPKSFKGGKKYSITPSRKNSPLAPDEETINDWIENQPNPSRYALVETPEMIKEKCEDIMGLLAPSAPTRRSAAAAPTNRRLAATPGGKATKPRTAADDAMEPPEENTDAVDPDGYIAPEDE